MINKIIDTAKIRVTVIARINVINKTKNSRVTMALRGMTHESSPKIDRRVIHLEPRTLSETMQKQTHSPTKMTTPLLPLATSMMAQFFYKKPRTTSRLRKKKISCEILTLCSFIFKIHYNKLKYISHRHRVHVLYYKTNIDYKRSYPKAKHSY